MDAAETFPQDGRLWPWLWPSVSEPVSDLAESLRRELRRLYPSLHEVPYPVWQGLGFHGPSGYVFGVFLRAGHLELSFDRGAELEDPGQWLLGGGQRVRFLKFFGPADLRLQPWRDLTRRAFERWGS